MDIFLKNRQDDNINSVIVNNFGNNNVTNISNCRNNDNWNSVIVNNFGNDNVTNISNCGNNEKRSMIRLADILLIIKRIIEIFLVFHYIPFLI